MVKKVRTMCRLCAWGLTSISVVAVLVLLRPVMSAGSCGRKHCPKPGFGPRVAFS